MRDCRCTSASCSPHWKRPTYIERVALSDMKNIMKAKKAVKKALQIQKDGGGFSLVEFLSPCPTILKMDPVVARKWVGETLMKAFPLGVYRDRKPELPEDAVVPHKTVAEALEVHEATAMSRSQRRHHHTRELTVKIAGFGGQGILLMGQLLAEMGLREHMEVSWLPSYGPEMRSGSAHCHVTLVARPHRHAADLAARSAGRDERALAAQVRSHRRLRRTDPLQLRPKLPDGFSAPQARVVCVPASEIADKLGSAKVANVVMLGRAAGRDRMPARGIGDLGAGRHGEAIPSCWNSTGRPLLPDATTSTPS